MREASESSKRTRSEDPYEKSELETQPSSKEPPPVPTIGALAMDSCKIPAHENAADKLPSPETIFGTVIDLILRMIECPLIGFVVHFYVELSTQEQWLLFCSTTQLLKIDFYNSFTFTKDQINEITTLYTSYTGVQIPSVRGKLAGLLVRFSS